jgi:hypothetical protein
MNRASDTHDNVANEKGTMSIWSSICLGSMAVLVLLALALPSCLENEEERQWREAAKPAPVFLENYLIDEDQNIIPRRPATTQSVDSKLPRE